MCDSRGRMQELRRSSLFNAAAAAAARASDLASDAVSAALDTASIDTVEYAAESPPAPRSSASILVPNTPEPESPAAEDVQAALREREKLAHSFDREVQTLLQTAQRVSAAEQRARSAEQQCVHLTACLECATHELRACDAELAATLRGQLQQKAPPDVVSAVREAEARAASLAVELEELRRSVAADRAPSVDGSVGDAARLEAAALAERDSALQGLSRTKGELDALRLHLLDSEEAHGRREAELAE